MGILRWLAKHFDEKDKKCAYNYCNRHDLVILPNEIVAMMMVGKALEEVLEKTKEYDLDNELIKIEKTFNQKGKLHEN